MGNFSMSSGKFHMSSGNFPMLLGNFCMSRGIFCMSRGIFDMSKQCKECGATYQPANMRQTVCSPACAIAFTRREEQKKKDKQRKEALKTLTDYRKSAQSAFNRYIRARDHGRGCISCGTKTAGQYHAGHYRTRKAAPQLAFNTFNVHLQCAQCNNMQSGNIVEYRLNLLKRIGQHRVEQLESNQSMAKHSKAYLIRLQRVFSRRAKHIEKLRHCLQSKDNGGY